MAVDANEYNYLSKLSNDELMLLYQKLGKHYGSMYGLVYFISDGNYIKIGMTESMYIQSRIASLQTGNPNKLIMIGFSICETKRHSWIGNASQMISHEKDIQSRYEQFRKLGEWFSVSENKIFEFSDVTKTRELMKGKQRFCCYPEIRKAVI